MLMLGSFLVSSLMKQSTQRQWLTCPPSVAHAHRMLQLSCEQNHPNECIRWNGGSELLQPRLAAAEQLPLMSILSGWIQVSWV